MEIQPRVTQCDWEKMQERFGDQARAQLSSVQDFLKAVSYRTNHALNIWPLNTLMELIEAARAGNPECFALVDQIQDDFRDALKDTVKNIYVEARK